MKLDSNPALDYQVAEAYPDTEGQRWGVPVQVVSPSQGECTSIPHQHICTLQMLFFSKFQNQRQILPVWKMICMGACTRMKTGVSLAAGFWVTVSDSVRIQNPTSSAWPTRVSASQEGHEASQLCALHCAA